MKKLIGLLALSILFGILLLPWGTNLRAQGTHNITLAWNAPTTGGAVATYNVKRSTSSGTEATIASTPANTRTYVDSSGTAGTTYFYVVTAVNQFGESGPTNEVSAIFQGDRPGTPAGLSAVTQ